MPESLILPAAVIEPVDVASTGLVDSAPRGGGRTARGRVETVLGLGGLVAAAFIALAALDAGGAGALWTSAHWTMAAATAFAATAIAARRARGHDRAVRGWAAAILGFWTAGMLARDGLILLGLPTFPSLCDAIFAATALPMAGWVRSIVHGRLGPATQLAVLLDGGAILFGTVALIVVPFGEFAEVLGPIAGVALLIYPILFLAGAGAGLAAVLATIGDRRGALGPQLMLLGLAIQGGAWLVMLALAADGVAVPPGAPINGTFSVGMLVTAAGASRWTTIPTVPSRRSTRNGTIVPVAAALIGVVLLLLLDDRLDGPSELAMRYSVTGIVLLVVVRQSLLLRERSAILAREQEASQRAVEASRETERALRQLAAAEGRFRTLVEQIPAAVYLDKVDRDQKTLTEATYLSPRVEQIVGYTAAEIMADNELWFARIHDDDREALRASWEFHCSTGVPFSATYRMTARDGRTVWISEDAVLLPPDENGDTYSQGVIVDVTERRESTDRLHQAQKMEAVGQLAGGIAHDFNNLLTAIGGHAAFLADEIAVQDPLRQDVDAIVGATASSAGLVRQLLAFGRRTLLQPEIVDVSAVAAEVLPMLRRLLPETIVFETALPPDLPAVRADPGQLQQVVVNLAVNARDAMANGGTLAMTTKRTEISAREAAGLPGLAPGSYVELAVRDTGIGMDRETRDRVFEPFFTTKGPGRGTGLGLATVYGIVKQSGGYIAIETAPGRGATFRVLLPATDLAPAGTTGRVAAERGPGGHETVLLVEDEPAVRELVARVMGRAGYDVIVAQDGHDALNRIADAGQRVDVLVSDMVMPVMSGPELARQALRVRPDLRVLLVSGYPEESVHRHGLPPGTAFLAKPFEPAELARTVRAIIDRPSSPTDAPPAARPAVD